MRPVSFASVDPHNRLGQNPIGLPECQLSRPLRPKQAEDGPIADAGDQVNEWQLVIGEPGAGNDGNVGVASP